MLFVLKPSRLDRVRRPLAATTLLVLATAASAFIDAAAQEAPGFEALRAGRYDEAVRTLRAQALDGNASALSGWVTALRETGDYKGAVEAAERGVERGVAGARALLGAALMEVGRIADARAALDTGAREPGGAGTLARVELGILEYRLRRPPSRPRPLRRLHRLLQQRDRPLARRTHRGRSRPPPPVPLELRVRARRAPGPGRCRHGRPPRPRHAPRHRRTLPGTLRRAAGG